ncbi:MAG TPA: class I SAM-dependent methyltransferase [Candidatus Babeliales bacterium]|nr:class I SAM-dependent methyltransferase [Candidatus Babeliales bacterium]
MSHINQEFDQFAQNYRENLDKSLSLSGESSSYFAELKVRKLAEWFPGIIDKKIVILDFGCGDGMMTGYMANYFKNAEIYGADPSPKSIEIAQKKYPKLHFFISSDSSTQLDFVDGMFDIICAAGAFHHIPFDMHQGYMDEIARVLKPGGSFVLFELNPLNPLTVRTFNNNPIDQNAKMLTPWYAYRLTNSRGRSKIKFYCFFPSVLRWLRFTEKFLAKIPCGALYAVIMQKKIKQ